MVIVRLLMRSGSVNSSHLLISYQSCQCISLQANVSLPTLRGQRALIVPCQLRQSDMLDWTSQGLLDTQ